MPCFWHPCILLQSFLLPPRTAQLFVCQESYFQSPLPLPHVTSCVLSFCRNTSFSSLSPEELALQDLRLLWEACSELHSTRGPFMRGQEPLPPNMT